VAEGPPAQSDSLGNFYIRKTKTGKKVSFIAADIPRIGRFSQGQKMLKLQTLPRLRFEFIDQAADFKYKLISVLGRI
jgi:hypothetical protein